MLRQDVGLENGHFQIACKSDLRIDLKFINPVLDLSSNTCCSSGTIRTKLINRVLGPEKLVNILFKYWTYAS